MPEPAAAALERAVLAVLLPDSIIDLAAAGATVETSVTPTRGDIVVTLGFPADRIRERLQSAVSRAVRQIPGNEARGVRIEWRVVPHTVQGNLTPSPAVKNVIAVASGKGGVGKSTTAVNLALALAGEGAKVGMLDADVYGPSQPLMLGLSGQQPESRDGKTFEPLTAHGIEVISVGFLVKDTAPVIWRGPMVTQAIQQLAFQTNWHDLDYLIVDLPPGTGDSQLTLSQKVPLAGVVIVTTPQEIALQVARRGLRMFEKVGVSILGIVENMSGVICSRCGHEENVFGSGGGGRLADECGVPLLGRVPLNSLIREQTDAGKPPVAADPEGPVASRYREIAQRLAIELARRPKDRKHLFGKIVIEEKK